jgi:phosphonopyruvate decarboxylase
MKKGMVAAYPLTKELPAVDSPEMHRHKTEYPAATELISRHDVLEDLIAGTHVLTTILIATTGFSGRELYSIEDRPNQLYMVGSMGCAVSLGLGLALAKPDKKIIVVDGDGASLMRLGNLATVGAYGPHNFYHLLLDNGMHESTGGQATVSASIDFAAMAMACGYRTVNRGTDGRGLDGLLTARSPAFLQIKTRQGVPDDLARPGIHPVAVVRRLMRHMGIVTGWMDFKQ